MKRAAWTHSLAGLPLSTIALAISANAHAVDQRIVVISLLGAVLVITFFLFLFSSGCEMEIGRKYTLYSQKLLTRQLSPRNGRNIS